MMDSLEIVSLTRLLTHKDDAPEFDAPFIGKVASEQLCSLAEKLKAIAAGVLTRNEREVLLDEAFALDRIAARFRDGLYQGAIVRSDREKLLAADAALMVTAGVSMEYQTKQWPDAVNETVCAFNTNRRPNVSTYIVEPQS